jgi:hypothetical protein
MTQNSVSVSYRKYDFFSFELSKTLTGLISGTQEKKVICPHRVMLGKKVISCLSTPVCLLLCHAMMYACLNEATENK